MQDLQQKLLVRGKWKDISQSFSAMYGVFERFLPIIWLRTPRAARAWVSRAAWVQLLPGAWGCYDSQQRWVCPIPAVRRLAGRAQHWQEMLLGVLGTPQWQGCGVGWAGVSCSPWGGWWQGWPMAQWLWEEKSDLQPSLGSSGSGERAEPTGRSDQGLGEAHGDGSRWLRLNTAFHPITYFLTVKDG